MLLHLRRFASQRVRILEQLPKHDPPDPNVKYRLAHERLIPALESLSGELLAATEHTKRLLDERYRTWVNAKHHRKFLLSGKELRDVLKYWRHFAGTSTADKLQYIKQSNKARYIKASLSISSVLCLLLWQPFNVKVVEPWKRELRLKDFKAQFVTVEGGVFQMGDSLESRNETVHQIKLASFRIGKYEITNQQYCDSLNSDDSAKVKAGVWLDLSSPYHPIRQKDGRFMVVDEDRRHNPVATVNWFGAAAFCNYLNARFDFKPSYDANDWRCDFSAKGFRLPTEAEWEYAARGGNKSKGFRYSGSDSIEAVAWYYGNADLKIYAVGRKAPNELGLYDMSGNAWEWCYDWYDEQYYDECK